MGDFNPGFSFAFGGGQHEAAWDFAGTYLHVETIHRLPRDISQLHVIHIK